MPRLFVTLLLITIAFLLPACAKNLASNSLVVATPETLPAEGPAVDVSNFRGSVDIRVKPWRSDIAVSYDVVACSDVQDEDAARAAVTVHAQIDTTGERPVLVVRSGSTRDADDHHVRINIEMPACSGVRVINRGGEVTIHNTSGAVQVENEGAAVEVKTNHPLAAPVALSTSDASIYLRAPRNSDAAVDAHAEGGKVVWEATDSTTKLSAFRSTPGKMSVSVNEGGHAVMLRTRAGDIHVSFLENPVGRVVYFK
ncbi:MAG: hypothetical protein AB7G17_01470 [Phycisphaerales bacterium]